MFKGQIKLGRILGVEIALHYSWFIIAALLTMSLARHLTTVNAEWATALIWTAAVITAVAFFGAILLHELSHAAAARAQGIPVSSITLFALGGVAQMKSGAKEALGELRIAIAGPIASVLIGSVALAVATVLGWEYDATPRTPGMAMLVWFGFINLTLAVFNMLPGFPLDGGRVLRALVWWWSGDQGRATRTAGAIGQAVALGLIFLGFMSVFRGGSLGGLWLVIIGLFLSFAGRAETFQARVVETLRGIRVSDVMSQDCPIVERGRSVADVAEEVLRTGRRCFFILDGDKVAGLLTPQELRSVPRDRWSVTPASEVMRPLERLHHVEAEAPVADALDVIGRENVNQLPVMDHGHLRGVISREQIVRLLSVRNELAA
jgi:Zn-dependent protease/predicted transcriptional regulator